MPARTGLVVATRNTVDEFVQLERAVMPLYVLHIIVYNRHGLEPLAPLDYVTFPQVRNETLLQ